MGKLRQRLIFQSWHGLFKNPMIQQIKKRERKSKSPYEKNIFDLLSDVFA
jgi:hypothetical protein